jgi:hypothetical protein
MHSAPIRGWLRRLLGRGHGNGGSRRAGRVFFLRENV